EKAIDTWKALLRQNPASQEARVALKRLYQKTEKWNALLELLKEEIEAIPTDDLASKERRVERLLEVIAIYRDRLTLDVMVINTYNAILALVPDHAVALDALAQKYEQLGRWNDLISVLQRKASGESCAKEEKVGLLRRIAVLWIERFGNHAQAIKPLEELLSLVPRDLETIAKLKDIYSKRRQWRALLDLLNREVSSLPREARREHLAEMARLAAEKLGDVRAGISIWNRVLEIDGSDATALASLAALYERDKRWPALAEIYHRQRAVIPASADPKAAVAILERLGTVYAEKLDAPGQAAEVFREILSLQRGHSRAVRVLRDLYAHAGDYDALEELYGSLGAWDDLLEVLHGIVDRLADIAQKMAVLQRIARIAVERMGAPEKAARAHERILTLDPQNLVAARALVPIYRRAEKWARLLSIQEVLLGHAESIDEKLALHLEIRKLCEERLGSKVLAFQWCARAYELAPDDEKLLRDLERLGAESDSWEQVAEILNRRIKADDIADGEKLRLLRELGRISAGRLHKLDEARAAWEAVLSIAPDDTEAMSALEELATQQSRWPDLLSIYRRRAEREEDLARRLEMLFRIAFIEEERVSDLDAAARTYEQILELDPRSHRALRALAKVHTARNDHAGLARALELELAMATESEHRASILLRLGAIYEEKLGERRKGLSCYESALGLQPSNRNVHAALEKFLFGSLAGRAGAQASSQATPSSQTPPVPVTPPGEGSTDSTESTDSTVSTVSTVSSERVEVAALMAPVYERIEDAVRLAATLEILRASERSTTERLTLDRRLVVLYARKLKDPLNAYEVATRVLAAAPEDVENRRELSMLAGELAAYDDLAGHLARTVDERSDADLAVRRDLACELAEIWDEKLVMPAEAEAAWRKVVEIDPASDRAYDALERLLRSAGRWEDLRELLAKREDNTPDVARRREILLRICDLYEGVLENPAGATDAYRRVLEIDPSLVRAYKALERLYEDGQRWPDLEALLGEELAYTRDAGDVLLLTYRRAELRAHRLDDAVGAVDLAEEVLSRDSSHASSRQLLEELFLNPTLRLRIARLLGPLHEEDGLWADLVRMLRGEREFATEPAQAVLLLGRIATILEEKLGDEDAAYQAWEEAVRTDPQSSDARAALERLARSLGRWKDAAEAWEKAIEKAQADDLALRTVLLGEVAAIYDRCLADAALATGAYRRLLEVDPGNSEAVQRASEALERLYEEQAD
ncbi:MAG: hypothetical protein V2A73_02905, partial [Pseudomonadota bacterium]